MEGSCPIRDMKRSASLQLLLLLALQCAFLPVPSQCSVTHDVSALIAFKQSIFEDPLTVMSDWNSFDSNPCNWTGIYCSRPQNRVITLNLSSSSLKGFLAPELGLLSSLQQLILDNNLLLGTIPKQIGMLKRLSLLDLSFNRISGPIPLEIGNLTNAMKIDLHSNGLTGTIPPELGNLESLIELLLDRNRLDGSIPGSNSSHSSSSSNGMSASKSHRTGLCKSPRFKNADFSYNFFIGKIPLCLKYLPRSSFQGNCLQDKYSVKQRSTEKCSAFTQSNGATEEAYKHSNEEPDHRRQKQPVWLLILEIITGALMFVFCISALATALKVCTPKSSVTMPWKRSGIWKNQLLASFDNEMLNDLSKIDRQELEVACEDFSNIIGAYPDSIVYKGTMTGGQEIAVVSVCISKDHWTSYLEFYFQNKVADLARLNHENIAKLLGFCKEDEPFTRMLVFEYASNGTLYEHLHYGEECQLSWLRRMKVAIGIARGLKYLHTELQPPFSISDLNSNSVYLTEDFSPKLVDFESWKTIFSKSTKNSGCVTKGGPGSGSGPLYGFMDPLEQRHMDVQGNTFAFGVLLLEIITGRPPYCKDRGCLVNWAMEYLQQPEKIDKLVDPELKNVKHDDLAVICSVVSLCLEPDPTKRPSMQIICSVLENGIDTSTACILKDSPLAWAELALLS
ncbi:hypothetical protein J5N97_028926 [Dioscorea zingiberensis]|uniref:Protein kinase domain-containing protein n=1 Tax=Dioscorea zingiberensis TaxID=325984 RepID=A0A9D5C0J6_9LILI|nr:hypothetical protein J5N97_028926 [Dioscorea zingiberensis]